MTDREYTFQLSDLDAWILETIDNVGWYAYLWFPVVYREVLNFGVDVPDEEVYAAFSGLIQKGALLQVGKAKWGDIPEWKPARSWRSLYCKRHFAFEIWMAGGVHAPIEQALSTSKPHRADQLGSTCGINAVA